MSWKLSHGNIVVNDELRTNNQSGYLSDVTSRSSGKFTAQYLGQEVHIHRVAKNTVKLTRSDLVQLSVRKEMSHDNILVFIGACIDPGEICYLTQYCTRGSLQELLEDQNIILDWLFKISMISDIVNGMVFLHKSSIRSHGQLMSAKCFINSRWVVKIGGFGLDAFKEESSIEKVGEFEYYRRKLWTAPEILRQSQQSSLGTQKGDVYSFAIILQEIAFRAQPFFCETIEPKKIFQTMLANDPPNYRPSLPNNLDEQMRALCGLMKRCWSDDVNARPPFVFIAKQLKYINDGRKLDIVDNMLRKLEKYAENLEATVSRRTAELEEEKRKTDILLHSMLPGFIADELKLGRHVAPQMYDSATVYFSDIVGFTTLSSESTPLQVVDLLNDLYNLFDDILTQFDTYKVETIGDAYMVVSGLPKPNEGRHIVEICSMALKLVEEVSKFQIRHRPDEELKIRIGIHTGPCAAGVVGHQMPRYCLFGDTVNTASRMESTGEALRIHLSEMAEKALKCHPGYVTELRGDTFVKGKGAMKTYWLIGKRTSQLQSS